MLITFLCFDWIIVFDCLLVWMFPCACCKYFWKKKKKPQEVIDLFVQFETVCLWLNSHDPSFKETDKHRYCKDTTTTFITFISIENDVVYDFIKQLELFWHLCSSEYLLFIYVYFFWFRRNKFTSREFGWDYWQNCLC